jgi:hypothetical protein
MSEEKKGLPLETEPLVFFHPTLAGLAAPGRVQPVDGSIRLEEEPATWVQLAGDPPTERRG